MPQTGSPAAASPPCRNDLTQIASIWGGGLRQAFSRFVGGVRSVAGALLLAAAMSAGLPQAVSAQTANTIEPMALPDAMEVFARRYDFDVFYQVGVSRSLRSAPVENPANAFEALEQLLVGTGLRPRYIRPDAITLELATVFPPEREALDTDLTLTPIEFAAIRLGTEEGHSWYGALLLSESLKRLRAAKTLAGRPFELLVYVWLTDDGAVKRVRVRGVEAEPDVESTAEGILTSISLPQRPPMGFPQPIGLRIISD